MLSFNINRVLNTPSKGWEIGSSVFCLTRCTRLQSFFKNVNLPLSQSRADGRLLQEIYVGGQGFCLAWLSSFLLIALQISTDWKQNIFKILPLEIKKENREGSQAGQGWGTWQGEAWLIF